MVFFASGFLLAEVTANPATKILRQLPTIKKVGLCPQSKRPQSGFEPVEGASVGAAWFGAAGNTGCCRQRGSVMSAVVGATWCGGLSAAASGWSYRDFTVS